MTVSFMSSYESGLRGYRLSSNLVPVQPVQEHWHNTPLSWTPPRVPFTRDSVHKGKDFYFSVTKIIHWTNQWVNKSSNQTTKQRIHHRRGMEKNMRGWERDQMRTIWMTFQLVLILGVLLVVAGGLGSLRASADLGFVDNVFVWLIPVVTTLHIRLSDWLTDWQKGHNQTHLLQNSIKRVAHFDSIFISLILCVDLIKGSKLH